MSADEIMDKKARMVEIHDAAVDHIERALAHESPETVRRYIDEMYRELSETVPDAYHEKLAHEMTSWYLEAVARYNAQKNQETRSSAPRNA